MIDSSLSEQWRQRLDDQAHSGLVVKEWCAAHDIPDHRYYYWRRRLAEPATCAPDDRVEWLSVPLAKPATPPSALTVRVGSAAIDIVPGFDAALLRAVVSALEAPQC